MNKQINKFYLEYKELENNQSICVKVLYIDYILTPFNPLNYKYNLWNYIERMQE